MKNTNQVIQRLLLIIVAVVALCSAASATENGASVWPVGAESVAMAAAVPHTGQTMVYEYTCFYEANETDDAKGHKVPIPEFKLRVFATAIKFSHNWGVKFLGGELASWVAIPNVYEQLHLPGEKSTNNALSNINIVPFSVLNHRGMVHWYYEVQFETVGSGYQEGAALNIGQHNVAVTPAFGITLTPHHGRQEVSSRFDYVINDVDHATHYHGGSQFVWQFDARQEIPHTSASLGFIGYFYQQTTNGTLHGVAVVCTNADGTLSTGYKGRVLDVGGQLTFPIGKHGGMAFKWDHDTLVQNKTRGNAFWFQLGVPLTTLHHTSAEK